LALNPVPAFAQPQARRRIAAVGDELRPFLVGDAAIGDPVRLEEHAVARPFAIEGEPVLGGADLDDPLPAGMEGERLDGDASCGGKFAERWFERILGEGREQVGEEQLLVLLLVVDAELYEVERSRR